MKKRRSKNAPTARRIFAAAKTAQTADTMRQDGATQAGLFDFHCHSLLSDGVLLPSELVRRYDCAGFTAIAITDHVDYSNIASVVPSLVKVCRELNRYWRIRVIPGVELTHIPLQHFAPLVRLARKKGAKVVVGHGESPVEPVIKGTNRAAIKAGVDILAHSGRLTLEDAKLAAKKGVLIEITTRRGHKKTNSHVAKAAKRAGAKLIFNSDSHAPENIPSKAIFEATAKASGLTANDIAGAYRNAENLARRNIRLT